MALKTVKKAGEYRVIFSGDDALQLPEGEDESQRAIITAWETGDWHALIKSGGSPTWFVLKPLGRDLLDLWRCWKDPHGNELWDTGPGWRLLARLALSKVEGLDDLKWSPVDAPAHFEGVTCAPSAVFDRIPQGAAVARELGAAVFHREIVTLGKA